MPITMPGISSGMETDKIIEKLALVESKPILRMDGQIKHLKLQNRTIKVLKTKIRELDKALKKLYSFDAPFEKKVITSDPPGFLEGIAGNDTPAGEQSIEIIHLAKKMKASTGDVKKDEAIEATDITVNKKTKKFKGGNLDDLTRFLNENFSDDLTARKVKKNSENDVMVVESKKQGKSGFLNISDSNGALDKLALTSSAEPEASEIPDNEKPMKAEQVNLLFEEANMSVIKDGPVKIPNNKKSMRLSEKAHQSLAIDEKSGPDRNAKKLTLEFRKSKTKKKEVDTGPFSIEEGPIENLRIKELSLDTYNITRERPQPPQEPEIEPAFGIVIVNSTGKENIPLENKERKFELSLNELPTSIEFYTEDQNVSFLNLQLHFEIPDEEKMKQMAEERKKREEAKDKDIAEQKRKFPNLIEPARNAKMKLNGVEVEREKNDNIADLIDGANIKLKKPTKGPINLTVANDVEGSIAKINDFIRQYNEILQFSRLASETTDYDRPEEKVNFKKLQSESGPLVTNSAVRRLVNGIRVKASNAYPFLREPEFKTLGMIGVSSGKPGTSWEEVQTGELKLDSAKFTELLTSHPKAIRELFGLDSNGDRRIDNGVAFVMSQYIQPYIKGGNRGILKAQINANKRRIVSIEKDIKKKKEHVDRYTDSLRRKFGRMEAVMERQKATGDYLKQRFNNSKD